MLFFFVIWNSIALVWLLVWLNPEAQLGIGWLENTGAAEIIQDRTPAGIENPWEKSGRLHTTQRVIYLDHHHTSDRS